ncbi:type II secretion system protein GspG [Cupriavidus basilensis]
MLAALVVPKIMSRPDEARIVAARRDVSSIMQCTRPLYRLDKQPPSHHRARLSPRWWPSLLTEPVPNNWKGGGYLEKAACKDPWGHPLTNT